MSYDQHTHPLIALAQQRGVTARSLFVQTCSTLAEAELAAGYAAERANAPHRATAGKRYLVAGHQGVPGAGERSNRDEEHLALAIFDQFQPPRPALALPHDEALQLIEYQLPLKARQGDAGIGKVDLFGLTSAGQPAIVELKAAGGGDTPLRAALEGLAYAAIVQANLAAIRTEVAARYGLEIASEVPRLLVMAPQAYWHALAGRSSCAGWQAGLASVAAAIARATGVETSFITLLNAGFTHGLAGAKPALTGSLRCVDALVG